MSWDEGSERVRGHIPLLHPSLMFQALSALNLGPQSLTPPPPRLEQLPGNKGRGLVAVAPLEPGAFIGEYIGEVIDSRELGRRLRDEYAAMRHTYVMTYER